MHSRLLKINIDYADVMKKESGYAPNPECNKCGGFGKIHPVDMNGKVDYSQVILCDAPGCLQESKGVF